MKSTLEGLERSMQRERITALTEYYAKDENSDKQSPFFLRAVSKDGLMAGWQKDSEIEAIELAKVYSDDEVRKMINGVLDKVYHNK